MHVVGLVNSSDFVVEKYILHMFNKYSGWVCVFAIRLRALEKKRRNKGPGYNPVIIAVSSAIFQA